MQDQKKEALRAHRCLNSHPEKITCKIFLQSNFFDPRDLLQVKYEMVRRVQTERQPIRKVARQFGFSRPSIYKALAVFEKCGLMGLVRIKPGPRRPHKLNESVVEFVEKQKAQKPAVTLPELVDRIKKEFGVDVHLRSIQRALSHKKKQ